MSLFYLHPQPSSPIPFLELKGDHQQHSLQVLGHHVHGDQYHLPSSHISSLLSCSNLDNRHISNHETLILDDYSRHAQEKVEKLLVDQGQVLSSSPRPRNAGDHGGGCSYGYSLDHQQGQRNIMKNTNNDHHKSSTSKKWKPSKVRIMQKMMGTSSKNTGETNKVYHDNIYRNNNNNDGVRVCSDCHTTTTPLWRSGPQGPKSLCNACGIRQRKARRAAMAAAAATATRLGKDDVASISLPLGARNPNKMVQEMNSQRGSLSHDHNKGQSHHLPLKKRSKSFVGARNTYNTNNTHNKPKKLCFEDFALSSKSQRAFPRDEEEGAFLLMALSCGLACFS